MACDHGSLILDRIASTNQRMAIYYCSTCGARVTTMPEMAGNKELTSAEQEKLHESEDKDIQEKFVVFHRDHPQVYDKLVELARNAQQRGYDHYSISIIYERVRWHFQLETADQSSPFHMANEYRSRYARLMMEQEPGLAKFFRTRSLRRA